MGRIVINETENKQTVILNDSPAGVEGGYFDSLMDWHEFGGGGGIENPLINVKISVSETSYYQGGFPILSDGKVLYGELDIQPGNSETITDWITYYSPDDELYFIELSSDLPPITVVNADNCTIDGYVITITDPSSNASIELSEVATS